MAEHWSVINEGNIVVSSSPEGLWQAACKYFEWCDDNPIISNETVRSGKEAGRRIQVEAKRAYTVKGLCMHCGITEEWLRDIAQAKDQTSMYSLVVSRIKYVIHTQIVENAMAGVFNPIFSGKLLNIETDDVPVSAVRVEIVGGSPQLATSENDILEKLNLENEEVKTGEL